MSEFGKISLTGLKNQAGPITIFSGLGFNQAPHQLYVLSETVYGIRTDFISDVYEAATHNIETPPSFETPTKKNLQLKSKHLSP